MYEYGKFPFSSSGGELRGFFFSCVLFLLVFLSIFIRTNNYCGVSLFIFLGHWPLSFPGPGFKSDLVKFPLYFSCTFWSGVILLQTVLPLWGCTGVGAVFQVNLFIKLCPAILWRLILLSALTCLRCQIFSLVILLGVCHWLQYFLQLDELQGSINIPKCPLVVFTNNSASTISRGTLRDINTSPHPSLVHCTDTSG